jgi:hypothetical protein
LVPGSTVQAKSRKVEGQVTFRTVTCPTPSPLPCASGELTGGLKGTLLLTGVGAAPAPVANQVVLHLRTVITSGDATLDTDATCIRDTSSDGAFQCLDSVTGGTGRYSGASGYLAFSGTLIAGQGEAEYEGVVTS